ncbi:MAG: VOC family protein [Pseudomonadota bacterium]
MIRVKSILHATVLVADTPLALAFYRDILGLALDERRPDMGYPGAWLAVGEQQLHLVQLPNPDPRSGRPAHGGHDRHIALACADLAVLRTRLDACAIPYTLSRSGRAALFCRDPDGNALEFVFNSAT